MIGMRRIHLAWFALAVTLAAASAWPVVATATTAADAATGPTDGIAGRAQALFAHANEFWSREIATLGGGYLTAKLTVYDGGQVKDACGTQLTFSGPFYCPMEQKVYLDQAYLQQLMQRLPAPQFDLALAAVLGHELGRHIQTQVGTTALVEQARARSRPKVSRQTWITAALQADCYAGLWVHAAQMDGTIKSGAGVAAALSAVSDLTHQHDTHLASGVEMPDPVLDYGTAAQRLKWFQRGMDSGNFNDCDTFGARAAGKL